MRHTISAISCLAVLAIVSTGCEVPERDGVVDASADSITDEADSAPDVAADEIGASDAYRDAAETVDAAEVFVCDSEGLAWRSLTLISFSALNPPETQKSYIKVERDTRLFSFWIGEQKPQTSQLDNEKFARIDCIVSSSDFQNGMVDGFDCGEPSMTVEGYDEIELDRGDGEPITLDVTYCLYSSDTEMNIVRQLVNQIWGS